jgi:hypothetical protein
MRRPGRDVDESAARLARVALATDDRARGPTGVAAPEAIGHDRRGEHLAVRAEVGSCDDSALSVWASRRT